MVHVNDIVEGKVTGITTFGAFVQLQDGTTGLIHISEVSTGYVSDIKNYLTVGQTLRAVALSVERDGKMSLSLKRLAEMEKGNQTGEAPKNEFKRHFTQDKTPKQQGNKEKQLLFNPPPVFEAPSESNAFEDKLSKFIKDSDEKLSALKKNTENKRGGGYVRRG